MNEEPRTMADLVDAIGELRIDIVHLRADLLARIDRNSNAIVPRAELDEILLTIRREIHRLQDRVQTLEERRP